MKMKDFKRGMLGMVNDPKDHHHKIVFLMDGTDDGNQSMKGVVYERKSLQSLKDRNKERTKF